MKKLLLVVGLAVVLGIFVYTFVAKAPQAEIRVSDYKNIAYMIDGRSVRLVDGVSEIEVAPGSASKQVTRYFGNLAKGDLNGDGIVDLAFLLTQEGGGSGTFFYAVGAIQNEDGGYTGTDAVFLGDRIAPQTTEIREGTIVVNYAERARGEGFDVSPSFGKSMWLKLDPKTMQLGEVVQNFEGEADPSRMTLGMKEWIWIRAEFNDGRIVAPKKPGAFTLSFTGEQFSMKTDCNSGGGTYSVKQSALSFSDIATTRMFCEGSQESEFATLLRDTVSYHFTSRGELILDLKFDSGSVVLR